MRRPSVAGLAAALLAAFASAPTGARTRPVACAPGAFAFDAGTTVAFGTVLGTPVSRLEIDATGEVRLGTCATTGKVTAKKKATTIAARWSTCGAAVRLKLTGRQQAPGCGAITGQLRAKKTKKV